MFSLSVQLLLRIKTSLDCTLTDNVLPLHFHLLLVKSLHEFRLAIPLWYTSIYSALLSTYDIHYDTPCTLHCLAHMWSTLVYEIDFTASDWTTVMQIAHSQLSKKCTFVTTFRITLESWELLMRGAAVSERWGSWRRRVLAWSGDWPRGGIHTLPRGSQDPQLTWKYQK